MKEWVCSISSRTFPHHPHPLRHSGFHNGTEITTLSQACGQCKLFSITIQVLTMFQHWQDSDLTAWTCWYSALVSLIISPMLNNASKYLVRKAPAPASLSALSQDLHIITIPSLCHLQSWSYHKHSSRQYSWLQEAQFSRWVACNILARTGSHTTREKSANLLLLWGSARVRDLNTLLSAIVSH